MDPRKEGPPKPPYESPISYEIRDVDKIWDDIKYGALWSVVGPETNNLIYPPTLSFARSDEGKTQTVLGLGRKERDLVTGIINDPDKVQAIEQQLRQYVDDSLRLVIKTEGETSYLSFNKSRQADGTDELEEIARDSLSQHFKYTSNSNVSSATELN